jgi:hypothetical protein
MRAVNRRIARIPTWIASVLLMFSVVLWASFAAAQLQRADERVEAVKVEATKARTEAATAKAELSKKEQALAEANARLRQVGERPVDPEKSTPPIVAPLVALSSFVSDWRPVRGA